jgi:hypothetical protein
VLEDLLRHFTNAEQTNWDTLLPMVEFAINNSKHAPPGFTPFFLNYGLHPRTPLSVQLPAVEEAPVTDLGAPAVTKFCSLTCRQLSTRPRPCCKRHRTARRLMPTSGAAQTRTLQWDRGSCLVARISH